jgi:hypothetical protein
VAFFQRVVARIPEELCSNLAWNTVYPAREMPGENLNMATTTSHQIISNLQFM